MKLSEKGIKRFNRLYWEDDEQLHEIEFEPDDFKGMVCLTVDEVFTLKQMVQWVIKSSKLNNMNKVFLEKTYNFLNERFEKAEKGNEAE